MKKHKRELLCESCDSDYPVWYVANEIWNLIIRDEKGNESFQFLCPTCFAELANKQFVESPIWKLTPYSRP